MTSSVLPPGYEPEKEWPFFTWKNIKGKLTYCPDCKGLGTVTVDEACPACPRCLGFGCYERGLERAVSYD